MVGACGTQKRIEMHQVSVGLLKERYHPKYLWVNGYVVLVWILITFNGVVEHRIVTTGRLL